MFLQIPYILHVFILPILLTIHSMKYYRFDNHTHNSIHYANSSLVDSLTIVTSQVKQGLGKDEDKRKYRKQPRTVFFSPCCLNRYTYRVLF